MQALIRLVRAVLLALAASTVALPLGTAPAAAATCAAGGGVSVVVDFNSLGGGVRTSCVADGGGDKAAAIFAAAGHALTRAQRQPGFVCRVDAVPADDPCVNASPADAFWGLWWSNGTSGKWTYSSLGVDSLTIPDGGSVAFSWDDVDGSDPPSAAPPAASASPSASPNGSGSGSGPGGGATGASGAGPGGGPGSGAQTGGAGASGPGGAVAPSGATTAPSATTSKQAGPSRARKRDARQGERADRAGATPSPDPSPDPNPDPNPDLSAAADGADPADPAPAAAQGSDGGLPVWVAPVALLVLALGAGVTVLLRRRSTP